jgi:riboflavin synthase
MFTGITRGTYPVTSVDRGRDHTTYAVDLGEGLSAGLDPGASVSIDGVCQTAVAITRGRVTFDAIRETLEHSTLDVLDVGRRVAVERSARAGDEIGGHDVAGHVNGTGIVSDVRREGEVCDLQIQTPLGWKDAIFEKGFVAVDGSSLTVSQVGESVGKCRFTVHLIPETLRLTNLGRKSVGDRVNIELDARTVAIVRTVERMMAARETR